MASVQLIEIELISPNPALYATLLQFRIVFEVLDDLEDDMEVHVVWVGSFTSSSFDQLLDELLISQLRVGIYDFVWPVPAPQLDLIPQEDILGVTLLFVSLRYRDQEFLRAGFFVDVDFITEAHQLNPPQAVRVEHITRRVTASPHITTMRIFWV